MLYMRERHRRSRKYSPVLSKCLAGEAAMENDYLLESENSDEEIGALYPPDVSVVLDSVGCDSDEEVLFNIENDKREFCTHVYSPVPINRIKIDQTTQNPNEDGAISFEVSTAVSFYFEEDRSASSLSVGYSGDNESGDDDKPNTDDRFFLHQLSTNSPLDPFDISILAVMDETQSEKSGYSSRPTSPDCGMMSETSTDCVYSDSQSSTSTPEYSESMTTSIEICSENILLPKPLDPYKIIWKGTLTLKNGHVGVDMHIINGSVDIATSCLLSANEGDFIKITQRMHMNEKVFEEKYLKDPGSTPVTLLAVPTFECKCHFNRMQAFQNFLTKKNLTGAVTCNAFRTTGSRYVIQFMPKNDLTTGYVRKLHPDLVPSLTNENYLVIIIEPM